MEENAAKSLLSSPLSTPLAPAADEHTTIVADSQLTSENDTTLANAQSADADVMEKSLQQKLPQQQQPPKRTLTRCKAVAFGRDYFPTMGGARRTRLTYVRNDEDLLPSQRIMSMEAFELQDAPWKKSKDRTLALSSSTDNTESTDHSETTTSQADLTSDPTHREEATPSLPPMDEWKDVACSTQSTILLTRRGKVYQMGMIHGVVYPTPTRIVMPMPLKCVEIAAGRHYCIGRMEGGLAVVTWGAGHFGQLGVGTMEGDQLVTFTAQPVIVERLLPHTIGSSIQQVAAGDWHALALTQSGRVWSWGCNRSQQCGRKASGRTGTHAPTITIPLPVPVDAPFSRISAGRSHSVAIGRDSGHVYCWGAAHHGQCGNQVRRYGGLPPQVVEGLDDLNIVQVAAGGHHTMALTSGGRVFVWGCGSEGQLGLGPAIPSQPKPRMVADLDFVAIEAGREWKNQQRQGLGLISPTPTTANPGNTPSTEQLSTVPSISKIFAGPYYSAAVSTSGHLYVWGSNDAGQLGLPTPDNMPMKDGYLSTAPKTSTLRDLNISTFDSSHDVLLPVRVDVLRHITVRTVACGPNHMWCLGEERSPEAQQDVLVGRTLYEVQEEQRKRKLFRARNSLLAKLASTTICLDDVAMDDLTTTTDIDERTLNSLDTSIDSGGAAMVFTRSTGRSNGSQTVLRQSAVSDSRRTMNSPETISPSTSGVFDADSAASPVSTKEVDSVRDPPVAANPPPRENGNATVHTGETNRRPGLIKRLSWTIRRRFSGSRSNAITAQSGSSSRGPSRQQATPNIRQSSKDGPPPTGIRVKAKRSS